MFLARLPGVAGFQKTLVLKRILPHLARKKHFVDLFVAEASLAAEVRHRNVVQVFELGQVDGELYMAMEYVEGNDLRRLLRYASKAGLRIPPWFTVHVICEVLEALSYAYELQDGEGRARRVVHRDVTPSNIFISNQGEVKLGDFGVARDDTRGERTRAGQLKGKVAYMAPEQLYSRPIDQRTDLFAIGVVLWECLAQRRLFGGRPDIEMMNAICEGPRKPPGAKLSDVPPELDQIVIKALDPDPNRRWASAGQLQRALYGVLEGLRRRVTPADVRAVQQGLTRQRGPESALGNMKGVKSGTHTGDSAPSFTGLSEGEASNQSDEVLANPAYGGHGDSVAELSVDIDPNLVKATMGRPLADDLEMPPPRAPSSVTADLSRSSSPAAPPQPPPRVSSAARPSTSYGFVRPRPTPSSGISPVLPPAPRVVTGTPISRSPSSIGAPPLRGPSAGAPAPRAPSPPMLPASALMSPVAQPASLGDVSVIRGNAAPAPEPAGGGELDFDALVQEAVAAVRAELPDSSKVEQSSLIAGLDSRRLMGDARRQVSDRWAFLLDREVYEGEHPFFILDHEGSQVGPCSYEQALKILKMEVKAGYGEKSRVGPHPDHSIPARQALELLGMASLVRPERNLDAHFFDGEGRTPIRLFAEFTRHPISGRLLLFRDRNTQGDYREVELLGGEPTYVWTENDDLQFPTLLVSKRLVRKQTMPELAHEALRARRPIQAVVRARLGTDLDRYRPMLMKERLVELFSRGYASHTVVERTDIVHTESFAPNLLQVGLELCFRCVPRDTISTALMPREHRKLVVARDFERMMSSLSLSPDILAAVNLLTKGKSLSRVVEANRQQQRTLTTLAFFLFEAELLSVEL